MGMINSKANMEHVVLGVLISSKFRIGTIVDSHMENNKQQ
jgi:hypothetical protein